MDTTKLKEKIEKMSAGMDFDELTKKMLKSNTDLMPKLEDMMNKVSNMSKPKTSKNLSINDKNVAATLTVDNKVIIQFATLDEADIYFKSLKEVKTKKSFFTW